MRYVPALTLAFVLCGTSVAIAQSLRLLDLPVVTREAAMPAPITEEPVEIPEIQSDSDFTGGFKVNQTALEIGLKSLGAPHIGSRAIPPQFWLGADAQTLKSLMLRLKRSNDPALMQLVRDALLAETVLPRGSNDQDFLYDRALGLFQLGWYDDAERLMQVAPVVTPELQEIRNRIALYTFDETRLCPRPENSNDQIQSQKQEIFCLLKAGKNAEADLQTKLLQEIAPEVREDGFTSLVNMILLQETTRPQETELVIAPEPVHLLLARMGKITPHFPIDAILTPQIQAMLIDMPTLGIDQRLAHAEAAYAASSIGIDDLQRIQFARTFREAEHDSALTLLQQFPSPNSRALLIQVLSENPDRAELVIAGLQHDLYEQMLDSLMAYLPIQPSWPLARAHLAVQNFAKAKASSPEPANRMEEWNFQTEHWPLLQVINAQTPAEPIDEQEAFLESLIIDEDVMEPATTHDPWHVWSNTNPAPSQHKGVITALLPSLGVLPPDLPEPEGISGDPEDYGEALLNIALHLSLPNTELEPNQVRNALYGLESMGFGDVAQAYAARRLALLLAPV